MSQFGVGEDVVGFAGERVVGGTEAAGRDDAAALLQQLGGQFIDDPTVTVTRSPSPGRRRSPP